MQARTFEITFVGSAGAVVRAAFDNCDVSVAPGTMTLRAGLIDQSALQGLLQRISGLGLELIEVRVVDDLPRPPSAHDEPCVRGNLRLGPRGGTR